MQRNSCLQGVLTQLGGRNDSTGDQTVCLVTKRCLETIGNEARGFLLDVNRLAAKAVVELDRSLDRRLTSAGMRDDLDQGHKVRRVERMANKHTLGIFALPSKLGTRETRRGRGDHDIVSCLLVDLCE